MSSREGRTGMQRLIGGWEYRHLRSVGLVRVVAGSVAAAAGITCLAYEAYGWATFFLVVGALAVACGAWFLVIDHRQRPRHGR